MSWSPGVGVHTSIGLSVGYKESLDLLAHREDGIADLVVGDHVAEIRLERVHLVTLRDQLSGVLAELDVLDAAEKRVAGAGNQVLELEKRLRDQAGLADRAEEPERAAALRAMAGKLTAAVKELRHALAAVEDAAIAADEVTDDARRLLAGPVAAGHRTNGRPLDAA